MQLKYYPITNKIDVEKDLKGIWLFLDKKNKKKKVSFSKEMEFGEKF